MKQWKLVIDIESGAICRVVTYDEVGHLYVITPVYGGGGKWNDMSYDGVKSDGIREISQEEKDSAFFYLIKRSVK